MPRDAKSILVNDLVNKYSQGEAFELDDGDIRFIRHHDGGVILAVMDNNDKPVSMWSVVVSEIPVALNWQENSEVK